MELLAAFFAKKNHAGPLTLCCDNSFWPNVNIGHAWPDIFVQGLSLLSADIGESLTTSKVSIYFLAD